MDETDSLVEVCLEDETADTALEEILDVCDCELAEDTTEVEVWVTETWFARLELDARIPLL